MVRRNAIYKNISQAIDEMMEDSKTEGIEKGKLEVLSNLLKKGTISIQDAADCMAVSVAEFKKLVISIPSDSEKPADRKSML